MSRGLPHDIDEVQAAELCRECAAQFPDGVRTLLSHNPGVATAAMELLSSHGEAAAAEAMASILEELRHPVPPPDNTSLRQRLPLPFAVGLRDGMATFIASMAVLAVTFFWRTPSPGGQHALAMSLAGAHLGTGAYFGAHLGNAIRGRTAGWIGGALLGLGGAALTLTNIYRAHANSTLEPDEAQAQVIRSLVSTALYSGLRDLFQGVVGRQLMPRAVLDDDRSLRCEKSRDGALHAMRVALVGILYLGSSVGLNSFAGKAVTGPLFQTPSEGDRDYALNSLKVAGFRAANEAVDGLMGVLGLMLFFHGAIQRVPAAGLHCPDADEMIVWAKDGSSRVWMNMLISGIDRHLPKSASDWGGAALFALTETRGTLTHMKPGRKQSAKVENQAAELPGDLDLEYFTAGGGECLLNAAAGVVVAGQWVCADPRTLRQGLAARVRQMSDGGNPLEDPRLMDLAGAHLNDAVQHLTARAGEAGYELVLDGDALLEGLPIALRSSLEGALTLQQRTRIASNVLLDPVQVRDLLDSVANYYVAPGRYLSTNMVPILAAELGLPLAIHWHVPQNQSRMYDSQGHQIHQPVNGMIHIRHRVASGGAADDHFERLMGLPSGIDPQILPPANILLNRGQFPNLPPKIQRLPVCFSMKHPMQPDVRR